MHRGWWAVPVVVALASCSFGPQRTGRTDVASEVVVTVLDERGEPVLDATYEVRGRRTETDLRGRLVLEITQPVAGVVTAPGKVPEPLVVSPRDGSLEVTVLDRNGAAGPRSVLHFGGDVMLGRRYQAPTRPGTATATGDRAARAVVAALAPIAAAADATIVNLETVVGTLDPADAYPGKRFLLQSPPVVLAALRELGVDAVTLGNNHLNDWRDAGVTSTLERLAEAGLLATGAGLTPADARRGVLVPAGPMTLGLVSATTVDGDFVNDSLPTSADEVPRRPDEAEAWQYERREFAFGDPGEPGHVAAAPRLAGDAWREFEAIEGQLTAERAAALWSALTAADAYPELQDWVARRGHGGAAAYDRDEIAREIGRLRADGADVVVVQFHSGFQFADATSGFLRRISHAAIDDGADLVVSHHPHVLQGFEWYRGRLVAFSLGNLLFDQDFLATFPSALLRVVVDPAGVVDARVVPLMLVDYEPVPVAGAAAERIVRLLDVRSALPAESERLEGFEVASVLVDEPTEGAEPATVAIDRNTGRIERDRVPSTARLSPAADLPARVPPCLAVRADALPAGAEYGVDLFGWGGFDDHTADRRRDRPMHWVLPDAIDEWDLVQGASPDPNDDALRLNTDSNRPVTMRIGARFTVAEHRVYLTDGGPADAPPEYTIELDAVRERGEAASIRLDVYHVDDADPTSDPESELLRSVELPVEIDEGGGWARYVLPVPPEAFEAVGGRTADAAMLTIRIEPAFRGSYTFDNVRVMEWRGSPTSMFPLWTEIDAIRSEETSTFAVSVSGCESV